MHTDRDRSPKRQNMQKKPRGNLTCVAQRDIQEVHPLPFPSKILQPLAYLPNLYFLQHPHHKSQKHHQRIPRMSRMAGILDGIRVEVVVTSVLEGRGNHRSFGCGHKVIRLSSLHINVLNNTTKMNRTLMKFNGPSCM
jgi:hypothetical protein